MLARSHSSCCSIFIRLFHLLTIHILTSPLFRPAYLCLRVCLRWTPTGAWSTPQPGWSRTSTSGLQRPALRIASDAECVKKVIPTIKKFIKRQIACWTDCTLFNVIVSAYFKNLRFQPNQFKLDSFGRRSWYHSLLTFRHNKTDSISDLGFVEIKQQLTYFPPDKWCVNTDSYRGSNS